MVCIWITWNCFWGQYTTTSCSDDVEAGPELEEEEVDFLAVRPSPRSVERNLRNYSNQSVAQFAKSHFIKWPLIPHFFTSNKQSCIQWIPSSIRFKRHRQAETGVAANVLCFFSLHSKMLSTCTRFKVLSSRVDCDLRHRQICTMAAVPSSNLESKESKPSTWDLQCGYSSDPSDTDMVNGLQCNYHYLCSSC